MKDKYIHYVSKILQIQMKNICVIADLPVTILCSSNIFMKEKRYYSVFLQDGDEKMKQEKSNINF